MQVFFDECRLRRPEGERTNGDTPSPARGSRPCTQPGKTCTSGLLICIHYATPTSSHFGNSGAGTDSLTPAGTLSKPQCPALTSPSRPRYLCSCCDEKGRYGAKSTRRALSTCN